MAVDANETKRVRILGALVDGSSRTWTRTVGQNTFAFTVANPQIRDLHGTRVLTVELQVTRNSVLIFDDRINMPNPANAVRDATGAPVDGPLQALRDTLIDVVRVTTGGGQVARLQRNPDGSFRGDTLAVRSSTADGQITSSGSPTWTTVQNGNSLSAATGGSSVQTRATLSGGNYNIGVSYLDFDTSSIGASATVTAGVVTLYGTGTAETDTDTTTVEVRSWTWTGGGLTTADWIDFQPTTNWTNATLLANKATNTWDQTNNAANDFTSQAGMTAWVNKTGTSECAFTIDRAAGSAPTGANQITHYMADNAGTTSDPLLTVTYTLPATSFVSFSRAKRFWKARRMR